MPTKPLSANKIRNIIALHWVSRLSHRELSKGFNVSSSTVGKYLSAFDRSAISLAETRLLTDQALRAAMSSTSASQSQNTRYSCSLFPSSINA
jgi:transposase